PRAAVRGDTRRRIMVVEDDDGLRFAIASVLENAGFDVIAVDEASAAIERLRLGGVDLVFLDLGLRIVSGREFMKRKKCDSILSDVPVVIMSGEVDLAELAPQLGAVAHMVKPFDAPRLLEIVASCLRGFAR